jgi:exo-beta-1,3-glucanase (GH17 family)
MRKDLPRIRDVSHQGERSMNIVRLFLCIVLGLLVSCNGDNGGSSSQHGFAGKVHGLNFSPYVDGQDPNLGSNVDDAQLRTRMQIISARTNWIRTFGAGNGLERSGAVAHSLGLKAALGAWLSTDLAENEQQLANLIVAGQTGDADMLIVGSEVLLRGDLSEAALLDYINRVKQAVPGVPVAYADTYSVLLAHPGVIAAVDVVLANYYPYWDGADVNVAVASIHYWHGQVQAAANGRPVIVSETGWPSAGNTVGNAVPSPENAAFFFKNFVSWARATGADYFYFEAFDESWKAAYEGPQGAHWGIWDKDGNMKSGMDATFRGEAVPDNWSGVSVPGGPGTPTIEFTYVPPRGSFNNLTGRVLHVSPFAYNVAVYIYVSGWWTKPTFASPLTPIQADGSWTTDITTGGIDEQATQIAAFLVPDGYHPPAMAGGGTLPAGLDANAVANVIVSR